MKEDNFKTSRNFLATDKVPETIFGIPVVQDESQYTEKDMAFFREHPDAGGYYDLGDEGSETVEEPVSVSKGGVPLMLSAILGPAGKKNLDEAGDTKAPGLVDTNLGPDGTAFMLGELKDVRMRKGWERAMYFKEKNLGDILDFSTPQGVRLLTAYPGLDRIRVTNEVRSGDGPASKKYDGIAGTHYRSEDGSDEYIWLNPKSESYRAKGTELYDTILHEGINHAIWAREPSFPKRITPYNNLTAYGYAMDLEEIIVDLASRRGSRRAETGTGSANSSDFVAGIIPHAAKRVMETDDVDGSVAQKVIDNRRLRKRGKK